jgi:hypothetical protein
MIVTNDARTSAPMLLRDESTRLDFGAGLDGQHLKQ